MCIHPSLYLGMYYYSKSKSKDMEFFLDFNAFSILSLCCCNLVPKFLGGSNHQNLHQQKISFDSALSNHIFENPNHYILFDETILISNDLGIKQSVHEAIKIKQNLNNNTSLNRDLGECTLNPMYTKLITENNLIQNKTKIGTNKNKPNPKRITRLATEKTNITIRNYSNF